MGVEMDVRTRVWRLGRYLPITALGIAAICWLFAELAIWGEAGYYHVSRLAVMIDPTYHAMNMFMHLNWDHLIGNLQLWIPIAFVFTWLTSNRHLLVVVLFSHLSTNVIGAAVGRFGFGLSWVLFAVAAALVVRTIGIALQNASAETVQTAIVTVLTPFLVGLFVIFLLSGGHSDINHLSHFFGFLFGGALEAAYVLRAHTTTEPERSIPARPGL